MLKCLKKLKDLIENQLVRDYVDLEKLYLRKNVKAKTFQQVARQLKKIKVTVEDQVTEDLEKYYSIIDFLLVFSTIATLVKCVKCDGKVNFHSTKKEGLGFNIKVSCESCKQITNVPSS